MRRALLASLALHGALLAVLLMQQGSVAPAPAALTVQLLPPADALARSVPAVAPAHRASKAPPRAPAPAALPGKTVAAPAQAQTPVAAANVPQAAASPAANPVPGYASVTPAPAVAATATAAAGSATSARDGSERSAAPSQQADRAVRVLQMPDPDYPPLSRERGEQGVVMLQLAVDASGRLGEVSVLQSSGFSRLDKAARAAVQRWRFQPAIENGQPVAAQLTLPVRFALDEN